MTPFTSEPKMSQVAQTLRETAVILDYGDGTRSLEFSLNPDIKVRMKLEDFQHFVDALTDFVSHVSNGNGGNFEFQSPMVDAVSHLSRTINYDAMTGTVSFMVKIFITTPLRAHFHISEYPEIKRVFSEIEGAIPTLPSEYIN
jgi:hypothetical protein